MASASVSGIVPAAPALRLTDGAIEALKWIGLATMLCDHVDKYLFNGTVDELFAIGRLTLPIFALVLGYNLGRPGATQRGVYGRTMRRLVVFGLAATPPIIALGGLYRGWWPLNVLFTLLAITAIASLADRGGVWRLILAAAILAIGGALVEFWWFGIVLGIAAWNYTRRPSWTMAGTVIASVAALCIINSNVWAFAGVALVVGASAIRLELPRLRWLFYAAYPLHLVALWLIRIPMRDAGFMFF